jgi:cytochrome c biogenesis protein CcdA
MIDVGYGAAFLAGLLSFFSPCVLPIVPPYLAYLAGMSFNEVRTRMPTTWPRAESRLPRLPLFWASARFS